MIVDYEPDHLLAIQWQKEQQGYATTRSHAEAVAHSWRAKTALQDGIPVMCAGIMEVWQNRAMAWAAVDWRVNRATFMEAHRAMQAELDRAPFRRLEMYVKPGFAQAWRWAQVLGFHYESIMKAGAPDGGDLVVFARLNGCAAYEALAGKRDAIRSRGNVRSSGARRSRRRG